MVTNITPETLKNVYIDIRGPIYEINSIPGPANARLTCKLIDKMVSRGRKIYEILASGEKVRLTRDNIYKNNNVENQPKCIDIPVIVNETKDDSKVDTAGKESVKETIQEVVETESIEETKVEKEDKEEQTEEQLVVTVEANTASKAVPQTPSPKKIKSKVRKHGDFN